MEYSHELKIPKERIAVLIGTKGKTKKELENATNAVINVDSKEGDITITGEDPLTLFSARDALRAIGRGFNPEVAMQVLKPDYSFEVISIQDYMRTKNDSGRLKGRVIGTEGKSRTHLEELTETNICVYGKTIGIIGQQEHVGLAKKAIEMLLKGSPHANAYQWLERMRRKMKTAEYLMKQEENLK
ncbi:MAG: RNA-processing protein [Nanoarchaeota archaeon]|nr:RNA-processing protein [Nanoarchaeota archaeon]